MFSRQELIPKDKKYPIFLNQIKLGCKPSHIRAGERYILMVCVCVCVCLTALLTYNSHDHTIQPKSV